MHLWWVDISASLGILPCQWWLYILISFIIWYSNLFWCQWPAVQATLDGSAILWLAYHIKNCCNDPMHSWCTPSKQAMKNYCLYHQPLEHNDRATFQCVDLNQQGGRLQFDSNLVGPSSGWLPCQGGFSSNAWHVILQDSPWFQCSSMPPAKSSTGNRKHMPKRHQLIGSPTGIQK